MPIVIYQEISEGGLIDHEQLKKKKKKIQVRGFFSSDTNYSLVSIDGQDKGTQVLVDMSVSCSCWSLYKHLSFGICVFNTNMNAEAAGRDDDSSITLSGAVQIKLW